jgi:hypothetical protein
MASSNGWSSLTRPTKVTVGVFLVLAVALVLGLNFGL